MSDGAEPHGKGVHVAMPLMEAAVHTDPHSLKLLVGTLGGGSTLHHG